MAKIIGAGVIGVAVGAAMMYLIAGNFIEQLNTMAIDSRASDLEFTQRMLIALDENRLGDLRRNLTMHIDGLIPTLVDVDDVESENPIAKRALRLVAEYRSDPQFEHPVTYASNDHPGDPEVAKILAAYTR